MSFEFVIHGVPVAKARPRFRRQGNFVQTYDIQSKEKKLIGCQLMAQMSSQRILRRLESHISVEMIFHTPIPKSWSQKRSKEVLGKPDGRRPDLDNYVKMYADAMNDLIYKDDNQIIGLWCVKLYSDKPRVEIKIIVIEDDMELELKIKGCPFEDAEEIAIFMQARELHSAIWEARQKIRNRMKNDDGVSDAEYSFLEELMRKLSMESLDLG